MKVVIDREEGRVGVHVRRGLNMISTVRFTVVSEVGATFWMRSWGSNGLFRIQGDGLEYTGGDVLDMLKECHDLEVATDMVVLDRPAPTQRSPHYDDVVELNRCAKVYRD